MNNQKQCKKCGHTWAAMVENPRTCPRCKSYSWDKARIRIKKNDQKKR